MVTYSIINVEYVDHMGNDLSVVNAARVSFNKESKLESDGTISERDDGLIGHLAEHNHWTPFGHAVVTFRISAPIFVARQLVKHQVGLVWNETSRRYVQGNVTYFLPRQWRQSAEDKKQGSGDVVSRSTSDLAWVHFENALEACDRAYGQLIHIGVCPEQARMVLPLAMMTEWVWTGSLFAWARVANLRLKPDAQLETRLVAQRISEEMERLFPSSWNALVT